MMPRDTKQQERMRLITEYRWVAGRIRQQAALDCFEAVWNTGMDEMFHDVMVSGMLLKFRSFLPIFPDLKLY